MNDFPLKHQFVYGTAPARRPPERVEQPILPAALDLCKRCGAYWDCGCVNRNDDMVRLPGFVENWTAAAASIGITLDEFMLQASRGAPSRITLAHLEAWDRQAAELRRSRGIA